MGIKVIDKKTLRSYDSDLIKKLYFEVLKSPANTDLILEYFAKSIATFCNATKPKSINYVLLLGKDQTGYIGSLVAKYLTLINATNISILLTNDTDTLTTKLSKQVQDLRKQDIQIYNLNTSLLNDLLDTIYNADVIIDAIIGIDDNSHLQEPITDLVEFINNSNAYKMAINLPTGIDHSSGKTHNVSIKSDAVLIGEIPTHGVLKLTSEVYLSNLYISQSILDKFEMKSGLNNTLQELVRIT